MSGDAEDTDALEDDLNEVTHSHHPTTRTPPLARHHSPATTRMPPHTCEVTARPTMGPLLPFHFPPLFFFLSLVYFRMTFACLHISFGLCRQARAKESRRKRCPEAQLNNLTAHPQVNLTAHPQVNVTAAPGTQLNSIRQYTFFFYRNLKGSQGKFKG